MRGGGLQRRTWSPGSPRRGTTDPETWECPLPKWAHGLRQGGGGGVYSACLARTWRQGRVASITVRAELPRDLFNDCRDISSG